SRVFDEVEHLLKSKDPLVFSGRAIIDDINDDGVQLQPKMRLEGAVSLCAAQIEYTRFVNIELQMDENLHEALEVLKSRCVTHQGPKPIRLSLVSTDGYQVDIRCGD